MRAVGRLEGRPPPVAHAYLDTETTGLSGGTGTYAFAAAVARPVQAGLEVVQLFLPEPAAEPAFLHALQEELQRTDALGTYNGATFDLPLLRTRWVMARLPGDFAHPQHVDLLKLARALLVTREHVVGVAERMGRDQRHLPLRRCGCHSRNLVKLHRVAIWVANDLRMRAARLGNKRHAALV